MRSSIACSRCRRSKIKCVNAGIDTTCRACESSGRVCVYPTPAIGVNGAKRDLATTLDGDDRNGEWDSPKRQRSRKTVGASASSGKDGHKGNVDVLESSMLTEKVWGTLLDLFQSHYATILPFLHPATFLGQVHHLHAAQGDGHAVRDHHSQSPGPKSEPSPLILLGVLTLTARFHPQLVAYHSPSAPGSPSNPLVASEFYASALRNRLAGSDGMGLAVPDLTRVQALLMLALHDWGMCRGKSAWVYVGVAIRLSQAMGLPFELENDMVSHREAVRSPGLKLEADHFGIPRRKEARELTSDDVIVDETKRRTLWACFIMDRCLSSGKYRPRMVKVRDLSIQLPSDNAFAFGERVRTSRLCDNPARRPPSLESQGVQIPSLRQSIGYGDDKMRSNGSTDSKAWSPVAQRNDSADHEIDRWEVGAEESVLSRVIRIIRIWGSIAKWACAGGRRNEPYGPWQAESRFAQLRARLVEFQESLPRNLQYSQRNTDTHIIHKQPSSYIVMHVVYFLSVVVLHRAYLPFLPLRCSEPVGPLDDPTFPREKFSVPDSFWHDSTKELFRAARQMMDLVMTCQERGVLVETPLVGFAIYNAAFMGLYATHFSHMDLEGSLSSRRSSSSDAVMGATVQPQLPTRRSLDILREMRPRLKMASGWFRTLNRLHSYFVKVKKDGKTPSRRSEPSASADGYDGANGIRPVRDGGLGGGLEEFKTLEKIFLEFGNIEDQVPEVGALDDDGLGPVLSLSDRGVALSETGSNAVQSESGDSQVDGATQQRRESWVPVNNPPNMAPPASEGDRSRLDLDRRPSLPLPSRSLPPQSPYSLPSIQHHNSMSSATSPGLPSPAGFSSASSNQPPSQYPSNRLQPLHSWVTSHQQVPPPPYSQSLPPINAAGQHGFPMLPPPGSVGHLTSPAGLALDGADCSMWSASLGGDDVVAFLDGGSYEQWQSISNCEVGYPTGWLSAVWNDLA